MAHLVLGARVQRPVQEFTPKGQDSLQLGMSCSVKSLESTTTGVVTS